MLIRSYTLLSKSHLALCVPRSLPGAHSPLLKVTGADAILRIDGASSAVWLPLRGHIRVTAAGTETRVARGEMLVTGAPGDAELAAGGNSLWLALAADAAGWRQVLKDFPRAAAAKDGLLPGRHRVSRALCRSALELVRATANGALETTAPAFIGRVVEAQAPLLDCLARCPGRTAQQRYQVFQRLYRVRRFIAANCDRELDIATLAEIASYSPSAFIRAFRTVFTDTPHAFLVDQRLRRAHNLINESPLGISEIAKAIGFENRCTFSRLFHRRFGVSAATLRRERKLFVRQQHRPQPQAPSPV